MRNPDFRFWIWQENRKTRGKKEKHTLGLEIWQKKKKRKRKTWKVRNAHCRTWNMVRKLTKKENEKFT